MENNISLFSKNVATATFLGVERVFDFAQLSNTLAERGRSPIVLTNDLGVPYFCDV